jgi:hypothetical protein
VGALGGAADDENLAFMEGHGERVPKTEPAGVGDEIKNLSLVAKTDK